MKILIMFALILLPSLSFAQTTCRSVELPDRFEAVCIGDEKAIPARDTPPAAAMQYGEPQQQAAPEQTRVSAPEAQPNTSVMPPPSQPPQTQVLQDTVAHRQGRQQYQKGMEEARAARRQLINDLQQK